MGGDIEDEPVAGLERWPDVGEPFLNVLASRRAADARHLARAIVQAEIALGAEELGHQAIGFGERVDVHCLHVFAAGRSSGEVDRLLRGRDVLLLEQLLIEEHVFFERGLIAVARVPAADREEHIAGGGARWPGRKRRAGGGGTKFHCDIKVRIMMCILQRRPVVYQSRVLRDAICERRRQ